MPLCDAPEEALILPRPADTASLVPTPSVIRQQNFIKVGTMAFAIILQDW